MGYSTAEEFNDKFVKVIKSCSPNDRRKFADCLMKIVTKKNKLFNSNNTIFKLIGFEDYEDYINNFYENVMKIKDKQDNFLNIIYNNILNMGYSGRQQLFDKFYEMVHDVIKGYSSDPKIIYGDSVTGDTPLLLRKNGIICVITIDKLGTIWRENGNKYQDTCIEYEVWSDMGWTKIKRVIKHLTDKDIYEIKTNRGYVKVTEDHSLLKNDGAEISPKECTENTKLLHSLPKFDIINKLDEQCGYMAERIIIGDNHEDDEYGCCDKLLSCDDNTKIKFIKRIYEESGEIKHTNKKVIYLNNHEVALIMYIRVCCV